MKKLLTRFAAAGLSAALVFTVPISASAAVTYANVTLNGQTIAYSDVQARPQIINGRTMVPFRDYAEALGVVPSYDEGTKTMSFNQNGITFSHVAGAYTTTVNSVVKTYDTPSMNINGYTMMPIIMIADALNATYPWDDATKTVNIVTKTVEPPTVRTVMVTNPKVKRDELVSLYITTNLSATQVQVQSTTGTVLAQVTEAASDSTSRYFTANFFAPTTGAQMFKVYGGDASGFGVSFQVAAVDVEEPVTLKVLDISVADSSVDEDDEVDVTVKTSPDVVRIEIEDEDGDIVDSDTKPTYEASDLRQWALSFDAEGDGSVSYDVHIFNEGGTEATDYFRIDVNGDGSSSSSDPQVKDVDFDDNIDKGDTVELTVTTNRQVDSVYIVDKDAHSGIKNSTAFDDVDDDYLDRDTSSSSRGSSSYEWELEFDADYEGYYYIYAFDDNEDDFDEYRIDIDYDGNSSSGSGNGKASINRIEFKYDEDEDGVEEGDLVDIIVRTNQDTERVAIFEDSGSTTFLAEDKGAREVGSYYEWDLRFEAKDTDEEYIVRAYSDDAAANGDEDDEDTFDVKYIDEYPEFVRDVEGEDEDGRDLDDVREGNNVIITFRTNKSVDEVEIYLGGNANNGDRIGRWDDSDDEMVREGTDYYEWEIEIDDSDVEEERYYVYIYNTRSDEDEYDTFDIEFR